MEQLLNSKFTDINLSDRLQNKLKEMDIRTIGDLVSRPNTVIKQFGRSQDEIVDLMEALSLDRGNSHKG